MSNAPIPFIDLKAQQAIIRDKIDAAIARVLDHGGYILGKEVGDFETQLAAFTGAEHVISCANGTDALQMILMAEGTGPNDAVFVPAFTFVATGEVAPLLGATPMFVDVLPDTFNMDPASLEAAIGKAKDLGLNPKVVIPVDLFGQPANYLAIQAIAERHDLVVIADAAQGIGASLNGTRAGKLATWTSTSFFPAKPLGCYGDGGAIMTDDLARADLLKSIRFHGKGDFKYDNVRIGTNSRLDTIQAAILIEKLAIFEAELIARDHIAARYTEALKDTLQTPVLMNGATSAWAQYTLKVENRDAVQAKLSEAGIPTTVYYPIPMSRQTGYKDFPVAPGGVPVSDTLAEQVLSLPMHPYLDADTQDKIIDAVKATTS
jgi:dTDP-4-amino-4,6-dideoxygalactose transaminase